MDYFQLRDFHKALNADVAKKARERGSTPPWLKDSAGQLEDPEYVLLSLAERGFLKDLRLLALRRGNKIRNDEHYLRVQLRLTPRTRTAPKVSRLRELGFLEPYNPATNVAANELVPSRDNLDAGENKVRPDKEVDKEKPLPLKGKEQKLARFVALFRDEYPNVVDLEAELRHRGADDLMVQRLLKEAS